MRLTIDKKINKDKLQNEIEKSFPGSQGFQWSEGPATSLKFATTATREEIDNIISKHQIADVTVDSSVEMVLDAIPSQPTPDVESNIRKPKEPLEPIPIVGNTPKEVKKVPIVVEPQKESEKETMDDKKAVKHFEAILEDVRKPLNDKLDKLSQESESVLNSITGISNTANDVKNELDGIKSQISNKDDFNKLKEKVDDLADNVGALKVIYKELISSIKKEGQKID